MRAGRAAVLIMAATACGSEPSPVAPDAGTRIRLVGSIPGPGSAIVPELCAEGLCAKDLRMTFEVSLERAVDHPRLEVELYEEASCGLGFAQPEPVTDPTRLHFNVGDFVVGSIGNYGLVFDPGSCAYPQTVGSVTTRTARVSLKASGQAISRADFALDYTFHGPPVSASPTAPSVSEICWEIPGPSGGWCGDMPLPDDPTAYRCVVTDADGDALTLTLSFRSHDGCPSEGHCWSESRTFEPRYVPLPVAFSTTHTYPGGGGRVTCDAVDSRGRSSRASVCIHGC